MTTRTPAEVLRDARRRDSQQKRQRVRDAVARCCSAGEPVSFAAVARAARVSTWLVYAEGVREHIEHSHYPAGVPARLPQSARETRPARRACARTSNWHAPQIRQLRAERDELRSQIRLQLGQPARAARQQNLTDRIDELTRHSQLLADQHQHAAAENQLLRQRVTELEDDLAATAPACAG